MREIQKSAVSTDVVPISEADLALINRWSKRELKADEVYTFAVKLCDNEVDRDFERFDQATLEKLCELFVGKTGLSDHQWQSSGQLARIYRTELCCQGNQSTEAGDGYCYVKAYAYMPRGEYTQQLIQEIETGIKKEVSVGCSVKRCICSICGEELGSGKCHHQKGETYDGKLCYGELREPVDAYEWSFVAVPAQRAAGVMKKHDPACRQIELSCFVPAEDELAQKQWKLLEKQAAMGRRYMAGLKKEVAALILLVEEGLEGSDLQGILDKLEEDELLALKKAFSRKADRMFRPQRQLQEDQLPSVPEERGAFLV